MEIIIHRVNSLSELQKIPKAFGCEIDIRSQGSKLILNHDPYKDGDNFHEYINLYDHGTLVLNIKEAGIESDVLDAVKKKNIKSYFLLDVEFPYIYGASRSGISNIAIRYSEDEPIQAVENYRNLLDWVWIDTNTKLPLDWAIVRQLSGFKTCLVCPERWGRPQDIVPYRKLMKELSFEPTSVMTSQKFIEYWNQLI